MLYKENYFKNLIIMTGLTRSGKTMLAPIVSTLKGVEHVSIDYVMEQVAMLNTMGEIGDDPAVALMRFAIDSRFYDNLIGRNINMRPSDLTGIWKSANPIKYLKRLYKKEGEAVFNELADRNSIFSLLVHDALWHAELYFKAFPDSKMIHIERHPVDLAYSWYKKGYGGEIFQNPRNATVTIKYKGEILPYYALGWEEEYIKMNECDRIISMISRLVDLEANVYNSLESNLRARVKIICFEHMVTKIDSALDALCNFLGTQVSNVTQKECKRQRCPRVINLDKRVKKYDELREESSTDSIAKLDFMIKNYEKKY